jgi:hypothetical protein
VTLAPSAPKPGRTGHLESKRGQNPQRNHSDEPPRQPFTVHHALFLDILDERVKVEPLIHYSLFNIHDTLAQWIWLPI